MFWKVSHNINSTATPSSMDAFLRCVLVQETRKGALSYSSTLYTEKTWCVQAAVGVGSMNTSKGFAARTSPTFPASWTLNWPGSISNTKDSLFLP